MGSYTGITFGEQYPQYYDNVLSEHSIKQYCKIQDYVRKEWKNSNHHLLLRQINGCLSKLSASIFQINRLIFHHNHLLTSIIDMQQHEKYFVINLEEACYDFESLIFQSRSTLDKLTWIVNKLYKKNSNSFSDLRDTITNKISRNNDPFIINLSLLLDKSRWLEDFMISKGNYKSLIDELAHFSFNERTEFVFNILNLNNREYIISDFESHGITLFDTTWKISHYLPFFILNTIAYYTNDVNLSFKDYLPKWKTRTIKISNFIENKDGSPIGENEIVLAKYFTPGNVETRTDNALPSL